jgi:hypothetical protein
MSELDLRRLAASRRARMDAIFIASPRTREAHDRFHFLMEHAAETTTSKLCVLLVAPSQSGKTRLIQTFAEEMNVPDILAKRQIPVLHVELQAEVTRKGLAQNILLALQDEMHRHGGPELQTGALKGNETELWQRVYRYLDAAAVKLLVLDEIHHVKSSSPDMARSVGECIKHALLKGPCPIVLAGIYSAELPFKANEQLQLRAIPSIDLRRFSPFNQADLRLFIEFLAEYVVRLEDEDIVSNASLLLEGQNPACILEVSRGVLGVACRLLKEAVVLMTMQGRDRLTLDDLIEATDSAFVRSGVHHRNPFVSGLEAMREYADV